MVAKVQAEWMTNNSNMARLAFEEDGERKHQKTQGMFETISALWRGGDGGHLTGEDYKYVTKLLKAFYEQRALKRGAEENKAADMYLL